MLQLKVKKGAYSSSLTDLRATGHHLPYEITCHLTQVNTPRLKPSQAGQFSIYLPQRDVKGKRAMYDDEGCWNWTEGSSEEDLLVYDVKEEIPA